jgi:hypothetical protein
LVSKSPNSYHLSGSNSEATEEEGKKSFENEPESVKESVKFPTESVKFPTESVIFPTISICSYNPVIPQIYAFSKIFIDK